MSKTTYKSFELECPNCSTKFDKLLSTDEYDTLTDESKVKYCPKCNPVKLFSKDWERDEEGNPIVVKTDGPTLGTFGLQTAKNSDNYKRVNEKLQRITSTTPGAVKFESKY